MFARLTPNRRHLRCVHLLTMLAIGISAMPAHAQLQKFNARLTDLQTALLGLGVAIITIAIIWVSYKMAYDHAKWAEVSRLDNSRCNLTNWHWPDRNRSSSSWAKY